MGAPAWTDRPQGEAAAPGARLELRRARAADGARLALTVLEPSGPARGTALLVHGFSQNRQAFLRGEIPAALSRRGMRVAVGELRGHGLSDRPRRWTLEHHLELDLPALAGAAADLGGGAPHLIAHSMGGMLGYASLAHGLGWRSLTTIAAPVALGRGSPLVGLAARASRPAAWLARHRPVPMDWFLARLAALLSRHPAPLGWRAVQRVLALTNPAEANPEVLREVLEESDPESMDVFRAFLEQALGGRGRLCGVDLVRAVRDAAVPVAVITGGRDIFAPPASVGPLEGAGHAGPRRFVVLRRASHVDLTVGRRIARTLQALVGFLEGS